MVKSGWRSHDAIGMHIEGSTSTNSMINPG
jgi:hypothetical protein